MDLSVEYDDPEQAQATLWRYLSTVLRKFSFQITPCGVATLSAEAAACPHGTQTYTLFLYRVFWYFLPSQ